MSKQIKKADIGLCKIGGVLGFFVMIGQALAGDASRYTHAFIVLNDKEVIAAQPGGARIDALSDYQNKAVYLQMDLTDQQRDAIVSLARSLEHQPYGYMNYLAIGLARLGIKPKWLTKYISSNKSMICSGFCDYIYNGAGVQLFDDGRDCGSVTPGDLANWILEREWKDLES